MKARRNVLEELCLLLSISVLVLFFMVSIPMMIINSSTENNESVDLSKETEVQTEDLKEAEETFIELKSNETVKVLITSEDKVVEVPMEEYIMSVVSGEMPVSFELEALKAQSISARTYLSSKKVKPCNVASEKGAEICDTTHCQVYIGKEERLAKWTEKDANSNWSKIEEAVNATKGKVLTYEKELVMYPQFFSTSSGKTENAVDVFSNDVPYLVSTESKGEEIAPKYASELPIPIDEFINSVNSNYANANLTKDNLSSNIEIIERSESGGVKKIRLGKENVKGTDFRRLINLNSTNFEYTITDSEIIFKCKGYGHGVGMSQWGANVMAKEGKKYEDILTHYYKGVKIKDLKFTGNS